MASRARLLAELLSELTASRSAITTRHVDLHATLAVCDFDTTQKPPAPISESTVDLISVGGRWDRRRKRYDGDDTPTMRFRIHRGQEEAARWLAAWLEAKRANNATAAARCWSALLVGGRRSGKSHLAGVALVLHAVMVPGSTAWAVSPTLETGAELDSLLVSLMPRGWYARRELQSGGVVFKLANGSKISLRSGHKASTLKAGRVDMALINEGQLVAHKVYRNLRGAVVDRGGVVLITANPPDEPIGRWIEDHFHGVRAGTTEGVAFELDPRDNPMIDYAGLEAMAAEVDAETYRRDVLGLFTPIGDIVMHAFHATESRRDPVPPGFVDVTAEVTRKVLGRAAGYVVGMDFQKTPEMVAAVFKFFRDPADAEDVIAWVVDEVLVDNANEDDLCDALESMPRWQASGRVAGDCYRGWTEPTDNAAAPLHCAVIADASGWFQDGAHTTGKTSDRALAARNWRFLYKPQKDSDKNPDIGERMKSGNARLASADGHRHLFIANHCKRTSTALRLYEKKHGKPNRQSEHAHLVDAVTYVTYRFFGRPRVKSSGGYSSAGKRTRAEEIRGW